MKKIIATFLALTMCFALTACSGGNNNEVDDKKANGQATESEATKIEKNIDAVAAELGLTDGEETLYEFIGATAGKEYNGGEVELYQFDTSSESYKEIESSNSISGIPVAAYNDGIVLIFANEENSEIKGTFETIEFK